MGPAHENDEVLDRERPNADGLSLTVIILTQNEAHHLRRAIASVAAIAARIIVVDSGSSDGTRELAAQLGAEVHTRDWINYAAQFEWALDNCAIDTDWVMRLDADEWIGADLGEAISRRLPEAPNDLAGFSLDRRHVFMGKWIRHGGRYPLRLLRIWRTGVGHIEQRWMDEHIELTGGRIEHLPGQFSDENLGDLRFFITKHAGYAVREAADVLIAKYNLAGPSQASLASTRQAASKRSAKLGFYNRLPLGVGPLLYFIYRYFIQLGFLDGREGLIYHVLQGFWYRFQVDAAKFELERAMRGAENAEERLDRLEQQSGLAIRGFLEERVMDG
ncbi:glycosyltransferase family 2 protein [Pontixanthobacter luteolus]|uniref:glycosyltransferase family 2 protein n=1 Tax=Pontixanthobacter luteolus TaxID=295089 RepID=UPI002303FD09|nr:glycosyltransferase family 2 protein [Pontixanthobacter luteolus]